MDKPILPEFLSCDQIRNVDRYAIEELGIPGLVLMENAARNCVDLLESVGIRGRIAIVCGKGNNGGDGFAMTRLLQVRGIDAQAIAVVDPVQLNGDAGENYRFLNRTLPHCVTSLDSQPHNLAAILSDSKIDWIVDALLGTGTKGQIRSPYSEIIDAINAANKNVMSVDVPSGLDADSGQSLGSTVRADLTGTFVAKKNGFRELSAQRYLGHVHVLDIGIPPSTVIDSLQQLEKS